MIIFPESHVPQGKETWLRLRLGRPTASEFSSILTPAKGQKSSSQRAFAARHVDERITGGPKDVKPYFNADMERGQLQEHPARLTFERETGLIARKVGFVVTDDMRFGCSPDGLLYEPENLGIVAGLEIKNYAAEQHLLWQEEGVLPNDFKCQVHGGMIVCGLKTWWWMNNCPPYDPLIIRVDWDEFTNKLAAALDEFDRDVFRPMLDRQCQNSIIAQQVAEFDREYLRMCNKAKSLESS